MTANILHHLNELKTEWRRQDFNLSSSQKEQYQMLIQARRERVKQLYAEGRVSKGSRTIDT